MSSLVTADAWRPADGMHLEPAAMAALRHPSNVLVTAGPGAGKTEMLAQKASYLLQTGICPYPRRILAVSFKTDSASNLAKRVSRRCGNAVGRRFVSLTFHAFAKSLVDRFRNALPEGRRPTGDYELDNEDAVDRVMREYGYVVQGKYDRQPHTTQACRDEFNRRMCAEILGRQPPAPSIPMPYVRSDAVLPRMLGGIVIDATTGSTRSLLTFDSLLALAQLILETNPRVVDAIRRTYSHVFLDEFQDITGLQYEMVHTLFANSSCTLTAVGDDKQRIMLWAGAIPEAFAAFRRDFGLEDSDCVELMMNYRSAPRLIGLQTAAYPMLRHGGHGVQVEALPRHDESRWGADDGELRFVESDDERLEADWLANDIARAIADGTPAAEIAILCKLKVKDYTAHIADRLLERGIRARVEGDYQELLGDQFASFLIDFALVAVRGADAACHREVDDTLTWLSGASDSVDYATLVGIRRQADAWRQLLRKRLFTLASSDNTDAAAYLHDTFSELVDGLMDRRAIAARFPAYARDTRVDERLACLGRLLGNEFAAIEDTEPSRRAIRAITSLRGEGVVPMMTIHKSKGLEFERVYLVGLEEDAFWSFNRQPDENRCSLFVALSRAKQSLTCTYCAYRNGRRQNHAAVGEFHDLLRQAGALEIDNHRP